jgi:hypothetical protein
MISENNRHNTETEFILVLGLPRSARASRLPTSSNQELDTTPSLLNQEEEQATESKIAIIFLNSKNMYLNVLCTTVREMLVSRT